MKEQNKNTLDNITRQQIQCKIIILIMLFVILNNTINIAALNTIEQTANKYRTKESYVEEEIFVEWLVPVHLYTPDVNNYGKVFINCTVLSTSNANITLLDATPSNIGWSPDPPNNTVLAPGESYSNNFTLVLYGQDYSCFIYIKAHVFEEDNNATLLWGYELYQIFSTSKFTFDFISSLFGLVLIVAICEIFNGKRKRL